MNTHPTVLFIDDDATLIEDLIASLGPHFANPFVHAKNQRQISEAPLKPGAAGADIIFLDLGLDTGEAGLRLLEKLCEKRAHLVVAVVPEGDRYLTAKAIECNPFFYITKPYTLAEVQVVLKRANEKIRHIQTQDQQRNQEEFCGIIGRSPQMTSLFDLITRVAEDDFSTVLIRGESGTGKELVAKAIHKKSRRRSKNFVAVNCAAIPDELLESELFGHTKGAFTGANQNKQGRIQYADGGTLFLDEIGDMKPTLQAKLLRVLQEKEFEPVGGLQPTPVDTRILAATHCDLEQLVSEGQFREDLYYRLSVIPLNIPPLKARRQDIPLLIETFIDTYTTDRGREKFSFSPEALQGLLRYNWKGNVRELENLIQHMSILYSGRLIVPADLPEKYLLAENQCGEEEYSDEIAAPAVEGEGGKISDFFTLEAFEFTGVEIDFKEMINRFESELIIKALRATGGNKKEAARILKLKRTTLLEKIKKKKLLSDKWHD